MSDNHGGILRLILPTLANVREQASLFEAARTHRTLVRAVASPKEAKGETYVVVIGEAANREHLGAYGYFRPTTPWLSEITKKQSQWLLFKNAYSSYCHTIPSLMMALTSANQYEGGSDLDCPSIIDTAKAAGFQTYWISEQGVSWGDNPLNTLASQSNHVSFVRPVGHITELVEKTLANLDRKKNNLIIIHLIGSHAPYTSRYPDGYAPAFLHDTKYLTYLNKSSPDFVRNFLNSYDSSIAFTDGELQKIWNAEQRLGSEVSAFIYFADHGEDVEGMNFHNASAFTFPMSHIPLAIGLSCGWKARYPQKFDILANRTNSYFTLDLFYNLLMGITDIRTPTNHSQFDMTETDYCLTLANAMTMTPPASLQSDLYASATPRHVSDDPFVQTRANVTFLSMQYGLKFIQEYADYITTPYRAVAMGYRGVEINIGVPQMTVGHYPEIISDYPLSTFLEKEPMKRFEKIWFDLKLKKGHDLQECFEAFSDLNATYDIKSRGVIESWEPGLEKFSDAGWTTSYYLYDGNWPNINSFSEKVVRASALDIVRTITSRRARAVSFDAKLYPFVKRYLEPTLPQNVAYFTWDVNLPSINDPKFIEAVASSALANDPRVKTILIDPAGP